MPADLRKPFNESCCDGGECDITEMSCQPCGCDKGAKWVCSYHKVLAMLEKAAASNEQHIDDFLEKELFEKEKA